MERENSDFLMYPHLAEISSPDDVKKMTGDELTLLATEIRSVIIETCAKNGGHLASNLGIVEATIALHRVFDCRNFGSGSGFGANSGDRIIFDVGHQAYAHKLLTGRGKYFSTLRQYGGISGFTNREESPYDTVTAGHSGTSLSTAVGLAEANRIAGRKNWVVAVIGDGSFTNGMIYEALNQVSCEKLRLIILLNDNEMSISKNVGGLSEYLSYIRTSEGYFALKIMLKKLLSRVPVIGNGMISSARRIRDFFKRITGSETWFESFGLEFIGPVNGNDLERLTAVLEEAKQKTSPVVVHMKTKKGLGYPPAECYPEKYHSTAPFSVEGDNERVCEIMDSRNDHAFHSAAAGDIGSGENRRGEQSGRRTFTEYFSDLICDFAREDEKICAITAAMTDGCGLGKFAECYPDRFFDVGIAEEHAMTMAGGLSLGGMKPVLVLYATFAQRTFDQLWHDVSLQGLPLVLMISHAGLVPGDGVTHQGLFDVGLFSQIPGVNIYSPTDAVTLKKMMENALCSNNISVIRYPKDKCPENLAAEFGLDVSELYMRRDFGSLGSGKIILTYGRIGAVVLRALEEIFAEKGSQVRGEKYGSGGVRVILMTRIFPVPEEVYGEIEEAGKSADVLVIEENFVHGGIGEVLSAELMRRESCRDSRGGGRSARVKICGVEQKKIPHGDIDSVMRYVGLDFASVKEKILRFLR